MRVEEVYKAIFDNDLDRVIEYLDAIEPTSVQLDKLDSFAAYAASKNRLDILKVIVCYRGTPDTFNHLIKFYTDMYGSLDMKRFLENGQDPDCC